MTVEEIKQSIPMPELAQRYGIQIRRDGMCSCPFHGTDRHPSMKIYKDSFHCFACGKSGDIFSFVMEMDGCDFKTAYLSLGGTYEHKERSRAVAKARLKGLKDRKRLDNDAFEVGGRIYKELTETIDWCKFIERYHPPYTLRWCIAMDALPELDHLYYEIFCTKDGKENADGLYILEKCRKIREEILFGSRSVL